MSTKDPKKAGRDKGCDNSFLSKYKEEYNKQAHRLCLLGAINVELAEFFEVNEQTIYAWMHKYPEFRESIMTGKVDADAKVAEALYNRAIGYSHPDTKMFLDRDEEGASTILSEEYTKHYPPDTQACKWWLTNRKQDKWRDKTELEVTDKTPVNGITESIQGKLDEVFDKKSGE